MRTVFTNAMVTHVFAEEKQPYGRSSNGNMHFDGAVFYSYATPIARIVKARNGRKVLLVTTHGYSPTTGQHVSAIQSAWRGRGACFRVPSLGLEAGRHREPAGFVASFGGKAEPNHRENIRRMTLAYKCEIDRLKRARSFYVTLHDYLDRYAEPVRGYAQAFRFKYRLDPEHDAIVIQAHRDAMEAKRNTPAEVAKRERARVKAEAVRAEKARIEALDAREKQAEWRKGVQFVHLPYHARHDGNGGALLRLKDYKTVQTSQGAEVPRVDAEMLFGFVRRTKEAGLDYNAQVAQAAGGAPLRVGHFHVDRITPEGDVYAGCHRINWPEIEAFAQWAGFDQ